VNQSSARVMAALNRNAAPVPTAMSVFMSAL
jgi:hypothetical protein